VVKFDKSNHVHVWDHSYSTTTSIQSVDENCAHDHSYYVKNTSVTKNCTDHSYVKNTAVTKITVIDHSKAKAKGDHSYADVVKFGDKHKNSMLGIIPMHALWRKVVLFIIKIMKNQLSPILKLNRVINRIV
jgi:hypothetical protein